MAGMILWIAGAAVLAFVLWRGWGRPVLTRGQWRLGAGLLAIGCLMAAIFLGIRGEWPLSLPLLVVGSVMLVGARTERGPYRKAGAPSRSGLSADEARALLGVAQSATAEDIRAAYARLMRMAHPDKGGTTGLAAQLNAARDRLLKG
jgi:hypothetical protein